MLELKDDWWLIERFEWWIRRIGYCMIVKKALCGGRWRRSFDISSRAITYRLEGSVNIIIKSNRLTWTLIDLSGVTGGGGALSTRTHKLEGSCLALLLSISVIGYLIYLPRLEYKTFTNWKWIVDVFEGFLCICKACNKEHIWKK